MTATTTCRAHARTSGKPCRQPAGHGTDHPGEGRCKLHGGASPIRHGRYSTVKRKAIAELIAKHEADPELLNVLSELALLRALLSDFLSRFDPAKGADRESAAGLVDAISKVVARIEKARAANAVTRAVAAHVLK